MSHITAASITAFLYAGAIQSPRNSAAVDSPFENWEGHLGFVYYAQDYAKAIEQWLHERYETHPDDMYPGVLEYEVIEPMGEWLLSSDDVLPVQRVLDEFIKEYEQFSNRGESK